ncbi:MAG TPA: ABC transporter permease, partial [Bryobacteraceae bacterium]|nr:ABC transporter permease [Bryobacteraceae bacterium]
MWYRKRKDSDFQDEIESHIRMESDRLVAEGMPASEAREAARRTFGNIGVSRERFYESQRWMWLDELRRNVRYGLRSLAKNPSFTAAAALTIALGVGANTAVFSLMDAVLLRPLPVRDPSSLVFLTANGKGGTPSTPPYRVFSELRGKSSSFEGMAAYATDELRIEIGGHPEAVNGQIASGDYFRLLGIRSSLGRVTNRGDDDNPVAVISDRYWRRRFAGDPSAIGKTFSWEGKTYTIAGITPPGFLGLRPGFAVDITFPIERQMESLGGYDIVARLKPGITRARAESESTAVLSAAAAELGVPRKVIEDRLQRIELPAAGHGADTLRGRFRKPLYALLGIAGLVLLLATANIANLLLARGLARRREFAIRLATGAARMRLVRQLITETLLLFVCGAIPGIFLARTGVVLVARMFAEGRRSITIQAELDGRVLAFAFGATLAAGLVAALFPALRVFGNDLEQVIREGQTRNSDSRTYSMLQRMLVASQVAISLVLLVSAVTFAGTLARLRDLDPGFRNEEVLTMSVELPEGYVEAGKSMAVWNRLGDAVRGIPGVKSASMATYTPLSQRDRWRPVTIAGYLPATPEDSVAHYDHVSDGYFETLGVPLIKGRLFTAQDTESAPRVAAINESAARKFFAGRDPIGQTVAFGKDQYRVVGIVRDTKHNSLRDPAAPFVFLPLRQALNAEHRITLSVAPVAPGRETALLEPVRRRVAEVDPGLMISEVISLRRQMDATLLTERLLSGLATVFGALAMLLAAVGLYGVLSYTVAQQRQLIGIRMALGATPLSVAGRVLWQSGLIVAAGVFCGVPVAAMAVRAADSLLWGVKAGDPGIYLLGISMLVG